MIIGEDVMNKKDQRKERDKIRKEGYINCLEDLDTRIKEDKEFKEQQGSKLHIFIVYLKRKYEKEIRIRSNEET